MIEKISKINNLAVFKDFEWDTEVLNKDGEIREFKKVNIIYGRNYSGKTTISRILRAMETGFISDKYINPEFCVKLKDESDVTQEDLTSHSKTIRVFNEDFINEKLKFINNPDKDIQAFAILGDNVNLENEIQDLKNKLGSNEEGEETELYKDLLTLQEIHKTANETLKSRNSGLENQLKRKATSNPDGIKYNPQRYGDQNYNITKLRRDITYVLEDEYIKITDNDKKEIEKILEESAKETIPDLNDITLNFENLSEKAKNLIIKPISSSDKIQELVNDAILNKWVGEGKNLHQGKRKFCAFCNNEITHTRWDELEKHFDEQSEKLKEEIITLIKEVQNSTKNLNETIELKKEQLYSNYHTAFGQLSEEYTNFINEYKISLKSIERQLLERENDILNEKEHDQPENFKEHINEVKEKIANLIEKSNNYTEQLDEKQDETREKLRYREIYDFLKDISYSNIIFEIKDLEVNENATKENLTNKQSEIDEILDDINTKQKQQKDERKGADKVREYLSDFFGHRFLNLDALEVVDELTGNKKYVFEIQRNGQKAYHLSEGEKGLIAFCYFMAKLQDVETQSKKPIIWIDDPISSLDSNHIFFLYSLIKTEIFDRKDYEQIFISTHNLEFLRFLKRLPGAYNDFRKNDNNKKYRHLIIERKEDIATIKIMPRYLRQYVTEFNHLFKQLYECSNIEEVTDDNYTTFYNFGNNARKFLEIFLHYKYPDYTDHLNKIKKFFGDEDIPAILTDRINNEYSHLSGAFERGATVVEVPEMNKTANLIIEKLKEDNTQYNALLNSIDVEVTESSE